jgi:tetratricopeptide (TPR) repeat protein
MQRRVFLLASFAALAFVSLTLANDEVTVRSKDKPYKGPIKNESARFVEIIGVKEPIPAEDIVDIKYEVNPVDVRINLYRPAWINEKDYNDPDPKKEAKRKANLADALKKYGEAYPKMSDKVTPDKFGKRHVEYKLAVLTARQALDENGDLGPAIKRLSDFKTRHPDSWQITACLQLLGRLLTDTKQYAEAEQAYLTLAEANVPVDTKQEAKLMAAQVSARAGKHAEALKKLQALSAELPKDSKYQGRAKIAQAECLLASQKNAEAVAMLRQVTKETADKNLKAIAYNTLGLSYYNGEQLKEARWEFLWVDVVYNQDKAEHAKALYYLSKIFDKLDEKERAQECRDTLISDRAFAGMEWQRLALKEAPKGP